MKNFLNKHKEIIVPLILINLFMGFMIMYLYDTNTIFNITIDKLTLTLNEISIIVIIIVNVLMLEDYRKDKKLW